MATVDPWDWTNHKTANPLVNTVAPVQASQEQPPAPQRSAPGPLTQLTNQVVMAKGLQGVDKGIAAGSNKIATAMNPAAVSEQAFQLADTAQLANQGLNAGQIANTVGATAAPLSAETAGALGTAAADTAAATGAATAGGVGSALATAAPAAAGALEGAGAAGTVAATNAWNPIGWAAMTYLGGKALRLW